MNYQDIDTLVRKHSCFSGMDDLLDQAKHGYRPSLDVADYERRIIADFYDAAQETRGCDLRAFRYEGRDTLMKAKRAKANERRRIAKYSIKEVQVGELV